MVVLYIIFFFSYRIFVVLFSPAAFFYEAKSRLYFTNILWDVPILSLFCCDFYGFVLYFRQYNIGRNEFSMELSLSPADIAARYADVGAGKTKRSTAQLVILGIFAGLLIAMGGASTNTAVFGITDPWLIKLICGLLFPFGLGMVVIMGAELFTGNCLIPISLWANKCTAAGMLRNWVIVYLSNFAGSLLVAAGCALFGQFDLGGGQLAVYTMKVAAAKCAIPFQNGLVLGFFCNVLVCLGVLMAMSAKDSAGKIICAYLPVAFFVLCGFEHCVANMFYISAGLFAKTVPAYVELATIAGIDLSALTVGNFLVKNLLPVTIGNILGGGALAWVMWFVHLKGKKASPLPC